MGTLILLVVCVILILVLYVVSGGWKKYDGIFGIFRWMKATRQPRGMSSRTSLQWPRKQTEARSSDDEANAALRPEEEVVQVLRDIYTDFDGRYHQLIHRINELEETNQRLAAEVEKLLNDSVSSVDEGTTMQEMQETKDVTKANATPERLGLVDLQAIFEPDLHETNAVPEKTDKYFEILDLLEQGHEEHTIAATLSVEEKEVSYVRDIMAGPNRVEPTNE